VYGVYGMYVVYGVEVRDCAVHLDEGRGGRRKSTIIIRRRLSSLLSKSKIS
jgi:hypothetical protein